MVGLRTVILSLAGCWDEVEERLSPLWYRIVVSMCKVCLLLCLQMPLSGQASERPPSRASQVHFSEVSLVNFNSSELIVKYVMNVQQDKCSHCTKLLQFY